MRSGSASREKARISASIRADVAGGEEVEDPSAMSGQQRGNRSCVVRPTEELGRLGELSLEIDLADDEGVVDQRGRCGESAGVIQASGSVER